MTKFLKVFSFILIVLSITSLCFGIYTLASTKDVERSQVTAYESGVKAYIDGDYELAYKTLKDLEEVTPALAHSAYRLGQMSQDESIQKTYYAESLEIYKTCIEENPSQLEYKYNYEWIKSLLKDEADENQGEDQDSQGDQGEDQDSQSDQDENQESQDNQGEGQDEDQDSQGDQDENQDSQGDQGENQDSQDNQNEGQGENQDSQGDQGDDQDGQGDQDESQNNQTKGQESDQNQIEGDLDASYVEQILQMLEQEEQDSLKNNQQYIEGGNGDGNDW